MNARMIETVSAKRIRQWGVYAFAAHCRNLGISLDDCLYMVTGSMQGR